MIYAPDGKLLFSKDELACKASGVVKLAPGYADYLKELRLAWGRPLVITSCCRSSAHNRQIKGHPNSLHVYDKPYWPTGGCCATDFKVEDGVEARRLNILACELGWSIGVPKGGFLHLDRRDIANLPAALFGYGA